MIDSLHGLVPAEAIIAELTEIADAAQLAIDRLRRELETRQSETREAIAQRDAVATELFRLAGQLQRLGTPAIQRAQVTGQRDALAVELYRTIQHGKLRTGRATYGRRRWFSRRRIGWGPNNVEQAAKSASFVIGASDFAYKEVYNDDQFPLKRGAVFEYREDVHGAIAEQIIFYGPYIALDPAVYLFTFSGKLEGDLIVDFSHAAGVSVLKQAQISSFAATHCIVVTERIEQFEIRAYKTPTLKYMRLEEITCVQISVE